uniref:Uncharacterized protein n=1 Tax=Trypanosoma congolense (strain IL3000) TaxID=1068625 RepID=G0UQ80_TRYCI|nr:conserved hypothetical protein [Trypanosoma congolense IL3000]
MALFKKRHGSMQPADRSGRHFIWRIKGFSEFKRGTALDSANVTCFTRVKFHLHITISDDGTISVYVHYKSPGIPKYSYYFANSDGLYMRQHTAHTIPPLSERCGHWNACHQSDLSGFVKKDDTVFLHFHFDDDTITLTQQPLLSSDCSILNVLWEIPRLPTRVINPFSSRGFVVDRKLLFIRLEAKRDSGVTDAVGVYDMEQVKEFFFFVLGRNGDVPLHSLEILNERYESVAELPMTIGDGTRMLAVSKEEVLSAAGESGVLRVRVQMQEVGNPLHALNIMNAGAQNPQSGVKADVMELVRADNTGDKEVYAVIREDNESGAAT